MIHHLHTHSRATNNAANDGLPWRRIPFEPLPPEHKARHRSHIGRQLDPGFDLNSQGKRPKPLPPPEWLQPALDTTVERKAYVAGWRVGCFHGVVLGLLLGTALVAGALQLGRVLGA